MIKYNINTCDQVCNELMVHFTKACENKCAFCVDALNKGIKPQRPNVDEMFNSIKSHEYDITSVTISGGEPCLYMEELYELVVRLKNETNLSVGVISSMPTACWEKKDLFFKLLEVLDNFAFSPQHYDEEIADKMRGSISKYDHQELYAILPYKEKICVNINVMKPYLETQEEICECIRYYNTLGFKTIRVSELFDMPHMYVSIENALGIKLKSPFAHGCKTNNFDITPWVPDFDGNLILKRTCFLVNKKLHANLSDLVKVATRPLFMPKEYTFGVVYEDGSVKPYWC